MEKIFCRFSFQTKDVITRKIQTLVVGKEEVSLKNKCYVVIHYHIIVQNKDLSEPASYYILKVRSWT